MLGDLQPGIDDVVLPDASGEDQVADTLDVFHVEREVVVGERDDPRVDLGEFIEDGLGGTPGPLPFFAPGTTAERVSMRMPVLMFSIDR